MVGPALGVLLVLRLLQQAHHLVLLFLLLVLLPLLYLVLLKVQVGVEVEVEVQVKGVLLEVQVEGVILEVQVGVAVAGVEVAVAEEDSLEDPARHDAKRRRLEEPHAASCRMVAASARENQSVKRHYL